MNSFSLIQLRDALLSAGLLVAAFPGFSRAQTLEANYQLDDVYTSSVGTIGALSVVGDSSEVSFVSASVSGSTQEVLQFVANDTGEGTSGVQAQTAGFGISASNYSVDLEASFDLSTTGLLATKVLDFKNLSSDAGLYINDGTGVLEFINGAGMIQGFGGAAITSDAFENIGLTRNGMTNTVSVYENGSLAFSFTRHRRPGGAGRFERNGQCFSDGFRGRRHRPGR